MEVKKITGKQVNLLLTFFGKAGMYKDQTILEWIEYRCDFELKKLEDIDMGIFPTILQKLRREFNLDSV